MALTDAGASRLIHRFMAEPRTTQSAEGVPAIKVGTRRRVLREGGGAACSRKGAGRHTQSGAKG